MCYTICEYLFDAELLWRTHYVDMWCLLLVCLGVDRYQLDCYLGELLGPTLLFFLEALLCVSSQKRYGTRKVETTGCELSFSARRYCPRTIML